MVKVKVKEAAAGIVIGGGEGGSSGVGDGEGGSSVVGEDTGNGGDGEATSGGRRSSGTRR